MARLVQYRTFQQAFYVIKSGNTAKDAYLEYLKVSANDPNAPTVTEATTQATTSSEVTTKGDTPSEPTTAPSTCC